MVEVVETLHIRQPASAVWALLADFSAISEWAPNVDHSCLTTSTKDGVGATRRIQTGRNTLLETVTDWEPERCLAYSITGLPPAVRSLTNTWRLADLGETTEVTLTSSVDTGPRPPQKAAARVVGRVLAKVSRQMLEGLDCHLQPQQQAQDEAQDKRVTT